VFRRSAILLAGACLLVSAQMRDNTEKQLDCRSTRGGRDARFCEVREQAMAAAPSLDVDSGTNGGIQVKGWSKSEVLVRARVEAWAADEARAKSIAGQVRVVAQAGRIAAEGPSDLGREGWSVSFEIFTPHKTGVRARAHNGGLTLSDLSGEIDVSTSNGGLTIAGRPARTRPASAGPASYTRFGSQILLSWPAKVYPGNNSTYTGCRRSHTRSASLSAIAKSKSNSRNRRGTAAAAFHYG
jgi:hypothetical protein